MKLILLGAISFGGGVWYSRVNDNFHDFFTEYIPYGEQAVLYLEELDLQKRYPRLNIGGTRSKDTGENVRIQPQSGASWRVADSGEPAGRQSSAMRDIAASKKAAASSTPEKQPAVAEAKPKPEVEVTETKPVPAAKSAEKPKSSKSSKVCNSYNITSLFTPFRIFRCILILYIYSLRRRRRQDLCPPRSTSHQDSRPHPPSTLSPSETLKSP